MHMVWYCSHSESPVDKQLQIRIKQLRKSNVLRYIKLYTQVHLVQVAYTCRLTIQNEHICMHTLSQEESVYGMEN